MAKRRTRSAPRPAAQMEGADEFVGQDAEKEAIEKIAAAKAAATKEEAADKANGHNGGPLMDEAAWRRACNELMAEELDIEQLMEQVAEARGRISSIRKVAKGCGVDWDVVKDFAKYQKRIRKGEMGEIVTEHRRLGELMKLMACPLFTQFNLWPEMPAEGTGAEAVAMEAELQGQHAYKQGGALVDNPFHAVTDTERHNDWRHGWTQAQNATATEMDPNGAGAATH